MDAVLEKGARRQPACRKKRYIGNSCGVSLRSQRSEEHTSELQSPCNLVCRLLLEKKKNQQRTRPKESRLLIPSVPPTARTLDTRLGHDGDHTHRPTARDLPHPPDRAGRHSPCSLA